MYKLNVKMLLIITLIFASVGFYSSAAISSPKAVETIVETIKIPKPSPRPLMAISEKEKLPDEEDIDENIKLLPYPKKSQTITGKLKKYKIAEEDTLLDIARHFKLGFIEILTANKKTDPWTPIIGKEITIPLLKLLPRTKQKGIVVNLAQMRLYYFKDKGKKPITFPIGVGREGLRTPIGETSIVKKAASPIWHPTERMREEQPWLPIAVPAGDSNPLGTHALYLGWPTFLIHGSNKPWAIGRRVSSGCMRMYPEDIKTLFKIVPANTRVTIVDQPILISWVGNNLYLEANPSKTQGKDIEITGSYKIKPLTKELKAIISEEAGDNKKLIDWSLVEKVIKERKGYPIVIASINKENLKEEPKPINKITKNKKLDKEKAEVKTN